MNNAAPNYAPNIRYIGKTLLCFNLFKNKNSYFIATESGINIKKFKELIKENKYGSN